MPSTCPPAPAGATRRRTACLGALLALASGATGAAPPLSAPPDGTRLPWGGIVSTCGDAFAPAARPAPKQVLAQSITWTEMLPAVIPAGRTLPVTLFARIDAGPVTSVRLELSNNGGNIVLLDNGVPPDAAAGDLVFSASIPMDVVNARNPPERQGRAILGFLQPLNGATPVGGRSFQIAIVAPASLPALPVVTHSATERSTPYVFNVRDDDFFDGATSPPANDPTQATQALIARFGDRFDFVDIVQAPRETRANRFHGVIRRDATGTGVAAVNDSASWGSPSGRLIGFTMFPILSYAGFSTSYNHELGHQWINRVGGPIADPLSGGHFPLSPLAQAVMGWSGPAAPPQGVQANCLMTRNGGTVTLAAQPQRTSFNDFELYLMGAIAPGAVAPSFVFNDNAAAIARIAAPGGSCSGTTTLATTTVDADTIVALHGARTPSVATSRKYFNVATVVISRGRTLDDTELRWISEEARKLMLPGTLDTAEGLVTYQDVPTFSTATGGRMFLDTRLDGLFNNSFE